MAQKVHTGDRIRLTRTQTFEGVVQRYNEYDTNIVVLDTGEHLHLGTYDVEILERAKPQFNVGDTVSGDDYDRLPRRAVVLAGASYVPAFKDVSGWYYASYSSQPYDQPYGGASATILYLPAA